MNGYPKWVPACMKTVTFNFFFTPKLSTAWLDPQYLDV